MFKKIFLTVLVVNFSLSVIGGNMKLLSFCTASYSSKSPLINGKLDDSCWKKAQEYNTYYVFNKLDPEPGKLKTSLRILWNEKGIFLGIINYDKNIDKIRKKYTSHDAPGLWRDDCAELYFDPFANSIGFTKITLNPLGSIADMRRIDAAITLADWNACGLEVKTSQNVDSWIIEIFIPWSDLGKAPRAGTVWKFCHLRFAWGTGRFIGITSSLGGSYTSPDNFGFLYFLDDKRANIKTIANALKKKATPPWCISQKDSLWMYENDKLVCKKIQQIFNAKQEEMKSIVLEIKKLLKSSNDSTVKKEFKKTLILFNKYKKINLPTILDLKKQDVLNDTFNELYWKLKLANMINKKQK